MVTAVVAAFALVLAGVVLVAVRHLIVRSERRTETAIRRIDGQLEAISTSVAQAVDRIVEARAARPQLLPTLDFDALVEALLAEAAARTGADAAVLRVDGPGGRPVVASVGEGVHTESLERRFEPPDGRRFGAATVHWTYGRSSGLETERPFQSSLVAPLDTEDESAGVVAVFSRSHDAFRAEQAGTLRALVEEAAVALANARRFAEVETRAHLDPAAGVPDRRGYEIELERAVTRARRTGRPLSVAIVALGESARGERRGHGIPELARMVGRMTRDSDVSCRRGGRELAIVLPETRETEATRLTARLRDEARRVLGSAGPATFTVGLAEWRPDESVEALDARAAAALSHPLAAVAAGPGAVTAPAAPVAHAQPDDETGALRLDAVGEVSRRLEEARRGVQPLTLLVLEVTGLDDVADRLGHDVADAALTELAHQLDRAVGDGSVHRIARGTFTVALAGSSSDAETLLGTMREVVGSPKGDFRVELSAGVTETVPEDDGERALGRAEHALWQARQAGPGTVVVALAGPRSGPQ